MTPLVPSLVLLLAGVTEPSVATSEDRTIEIAIVGPERLRGRMEETLRALIGDAPDVRWAMQEGAPGEEPEVARPGGAAHISIDVANPMRIRVYLPGCSASGRNVRTVEGGDGDDEDLVGRETVAQIVKTAVQSLRGNALAASPACESRAESPAVAERVDPPRSRARGWWHGMGGGVGWGYVPEGQLEWEKSIRVTAQTNWVGRFHLLPEVGYMLSAAFALAAQARIELIEQEQSTYQDPSTNEWHLTPNTVFRSEPATKAFAGFVRAIGYTDLARAGRLRLSYSADLGGGYLRLPVPPTRIPAQQVTVDSDGNPMFGDKSRIIYFTDTRRIGPVLFGGSVGLLWHVARHIALAFDTRVLSGLPDSGVVVEGQLSAQVGFGGD